VPIVIRRPRASADISEIWEFTAEESVVRADAFVDRIDAKFKSLAELPAMGRARTELAAGLRSFPVRPYVIYYEVIPDGVAIVRVLHGARDAESQFENQ